MFTLLAPLVHCRFHFSGGRSGGMERNTEFFSNAAIGFRGSAWPTKAFNRREGTHIARLKPKIAFTAIRALRALDRSRHYHNLAGDYRLRARARKSINSKMSLRINRYARSTPRRAEKQPPSRKEDTADDIGSGPGSDQPRRSLCVGYTFHRETHHDFAKNPLVRVVSTETNFSFSRRLLFSFLPPCPPPPLDTRDTRV